MFVPGKLTYYRWVVKNRATSDKQGKQDIVYLYASIMGAGKQGYINKTVPKQMITLKSKIMVNVCSSFCVSANVYKVTFDPKYGSVLHKINIRCTIYVSAAAYDSNLISFLL